METVRENYEPVMGRVRGRANGRPNGALGRDNFGFDRSWGCLEMDRATWICAGDNRATCVARSRARTVSPVEKLVPEARLDGLWLTGTTSLKVGSAGMLPSMAGKDLNSWSNWAWNTAWPSTTEKIQPGYRAPSRVG